MPLDIKSYDKPTAIEKLQYQYKIRQLNQQNRRKSRNIHIYQINEIEWNPRLFPHKDIEEKNAT